MRATGASRVHAAAAVLAALAAVLALGPAAPAARAQSGWTERTLAPGVLWRSRVYPSLFGGPQRVHVVEVRRGAQAEVRALVPSGRPTARVSALARGAGALAAVNGGYFQPGAGTSYSLVKSRGRILARNVYPRTSLGLTAQGRWVMRQVASADPFAEAVEAVGGGPRIVTAGRIDVRAAAERFGVLSGVGAGAPSPRTAAGITAAGNLLLVTVDGRSAGARGMTLEQLAQYMIWLGARDAMNLDGGGSTTCFVSAVGVVNRPSDGAERPIFSAIGVIPRRQ
jgi:hypothetical protein